MARAWFFVSAVLCACIDRRPIPLYPESGARLAPEKVATLYGDVRDVDGKFVSEHGGAFELLPGCHVVGLVESWGRVDPQTGGVIANLPRIEYALPMREAHRYVIEIDAQMSSGPSGRLTISAREENASGTVTRKFSPATEQELAECRP